MKRGFELLGLSVAVTGAAVAAITGTDTAATVATVATVVAVDVAG